ncbi:MAG TPA: SDR family NAD(P)-dependent oxidoreductase [Nitrososphaeraceae archaeon]|nr:SDR family NAD(P)-dependent oxidoreductase [Nitrososphaeraceae archaeon]
MVTPTTTNNTTTIKRRRRKRKFDGKIILITGASSGIGRQAAIDFANNGAMAIILVGRNEPKLTGVAALINSKCETMVYVCDISNKTEVIKLGRDVIHRFGRVDVLVNNAGFGFFGKVQDQSIEQIESVTATNYYGMIYCTKVFLDSMLYNKSGHIVNVASVAASFGVPGLAAYCGSKYAMLGFSESLYHELHGTGVGITVVSPIAVKTNFFNNKSFGGKMPNYVGYALPPKTVSNAIMRAANSPRLEIIVPLFIRVGVWLKQTLPYIINPLVGAAFRRKLRH